MFEGLYDLISLLWSWRWPQVAGQVTAVDVEKVGRALRLAVAYKFSVGEDGPYCGESFWSPALAGDGRVLEARRKIRVGHSVQVRYRPDDPSVNTMDGSVWNRLTK